VAQQIYNVSLNAIGTTPTWPKEAPCWEVLRKDAGISSDFNPLTVKARYVTGIILAHCRSVSVLLEEGHLISTTYFPAYVVFASAVDLLGRCIRGESTEKMNGENLRTGLKWLRTPNAAEYQAVNMSDILVTTTSRPHTIQELYDLRNFSAHGQALNKSTRRYAAKQAINRPADCPIEDYDYLMLAKLPLLVGNGVQTYLTELRSNDDLAAKLASAGVAAHRNKPIFDSTWDFAGYADVYPGAIGDEIRVMDWTYKERSLFSPVVNDMSF
jgi:hypothetical protein